MNTSLERFVALVDFLADFLGENTEVVLHDLSDLEHSIIKIRNSHVSGRSVGCPITDLVVRNLQQLADRDYFNNYRGMSREGKILKCASYFIRDDSRKVIGVLCVNMEVDNFFKTRDVLDNFLRGLDGHDFTVKENLGQTIDEMIDSAIQNALLRLDLKSSRLNREEKERLVEQLTNDGIFQLKGAVSKVARKLRVSEPTVYRYLSRLPKSNGKNQGA